MRSPRPGSLLSFVVGVLLCLTASISGFSASARAQNFAQPIVIRSATGTWPLTVYTADFNQDGFPDLCYTVAPAGGIVTAYVLLNDGHGNFTQSASVIVGASQLALGDLTGNGHVDIGVVVGQASSANDVAVQIFPGNGDGTFRNSGLTSVTLSISNGTGQPHQFAYVKAVRLHTTGALDIVAEDATTNNMFTFQTTSPTFSPGVGYVVHTDFWLTEGIGPIAVADLNGDGNNELIINGQMRLGADVYLGSATGIQTNQPPSLRFFGNSIKSLLLQDVNNDGRPDLIAEGTNGHIDVYAGNGDGTFQNTSLGGTGPLDGLTGNGGHLIAIADLNHDGQLDALTATPIGISTLLGQGTQYFGLGGIYNAGPGHTSYVTADFNGDGNLDLAVDSPEGIAILYGNSDGSFKTSQAFAAGRPAMSGTVGIFTSSGNPDAVVSIAASEAQFLRGNGDGTFSASAASTTPQTGIGGLWSVVLSGDFNGDGKVDLAVTADGAAHSFTGGIGIPYTSEMPKPPSGLNVQYGNGDGTFQPPAGVTGPLGLQQTAASPASFYGVSALSSVFGGIGILNRDASAYRYLGEINSTVTSGQFGYQTTFTNHPHNLVVSGFLRPGVADVIEQQEGDLFEYQNDGKQLPTSLGTLPVGDLAVDGSLTTPGQLVAPEIDPTFNRLSTTLGFKAFPGSAVIADLDGDGNGDLIVTYANLSANLQAPTASAPNYIYIWYGSGSGQFLTSAKHPVNPVRLTPSRNFYQVAVADLNGDGIPDLILSDGYIVSVQLGNGDGTFGAETHYLGGQGINTISVADVNHDGKLDLVLANGGAVLTNPVANLEVLATNPDVDTGGITVLLNQAAPALQMPTGSVIATPEPTTYGEAFGLTATITSTGAPSPTGTVDFSIDGNSVGSASLVGTTATISVVPQTVYSTLAVGTHTVTATYSGDSNYAQATLTGTHAVSLIPTTISLDLCVDPPGSNFPCGVNFPTVPPPLISPITMYFGQSIDGVAVESESDLTGRIIFYNGTSVFCTLNANLQQGGMMCPAASGFFPVGNTQVTVDYTGDATHAASMSNAVQVIVSPDPTTATVTSSANPSMLGQAVTFTANVQGNYAAATGSVTFLDGTAAIGVGTLDATGHATFTTSNLALGHHSITVAYAGNASFNPSVSPVLAQVVTTPVTGSVVASPEPSLAGNAFTINATVTPPAASATTIPTGTVAFSIDGASVGQATLANGVATLAGPTTLAVGPHTMSAVYSGDTNYLAATFAGSHTVVLSPTTTNLVPDGATTIYYGQAANSSYVVSGTSATHQPTGYITVQDNGVSVSYCTAIPLGSSCPYADGGANKLTLGTHALVVLYLGDSYNAPSASAPLVFTVIPDTTNATLTSSDNPALLGTSVTFTATIAGNYATPSGTVSFLDGATTLGTAALNATGGATFTTSSLAVGTHPITVVFNGNPDFNPVTSAVLNELITDGPTTFTLTVTPTPVTIGVGLDAVLQVTVTATGGFAEPVQLSCSGLPVEAACTFNQALIPAGGGITTLYFSTKAPRDCGTNDPYFTDLGNHPIPTATGIVLACLTMLPLYRRRRLLTRAILLSVVTLCGLAALSGCGHCTDLGTRPGNYTFTVTGTAQGSTPLTASQSVPVTVTIP